MERHSLTEPARQFLIGAIGSLERLEILLLMQRQAERWWTATTLANELRSPADRIEAGLNALGACNLISVRIAQDVLYRFEPGTSELRQLVEDVVRACADRAAVAAIISSPAAESVRLFAEAFRLRKGARDG